MTNAHAKHCAVESKICKSSAAVVCSEDIGLCSHVK